MQSFNENFSEFLTECRNNAIENLKQNERYTEHKNHQRTLYTKLVSLLNPEARALFEEYEETCVVVQAMEYNAVLLCGLTVQSEILKRCDSVTVEYDALSKCYL